MCQTARQARDGRVKANGPRVLGQDGLMVLASARNQTSYSGSSYALPDVAHEVDQTGSSVAFRLWQTDIGGHRGRDEQKSNGRLLQNAHPRGSMKPDEQVDVFA